MKPLVLLGVMGVSLLLAGTKPAIPVPDALPGPGDRYGCKVDEVQQPSAVDVKDVEKPPIYWIVHVWSGKWSALLPKLSLTRHAALHDCDKWMQVIDREVRKQRNGNQPERD